MSKLLFQIEAVEARIASYSCPRGTSGRVHALRLRHRFQPASKSQSTVPGSFTDWSTNQTALPRGALSEILPEDNQQLFLKEKCQAPSSELPSELKTEPLKSRLALENITQTIKDARTKPVSSEKLDRQEFGRRIPPHMAEVYGGDTTVLAFKDQQRPQIQINDTLNNVVKRENSHAIIATLIELARAAKDGHGEYGALASMPPNIFSEVLRCLDPKHFVGRYIDLHKKMGPRKNPFLVLQSHKRHKIHHFCSDFISQIKTIIDGRRSRGLVLSMADYRYLLRCARAVGNPRASYAVWLAMERDGLQPDTECYNHHLSAKVWPVISSSSQRYHVRVLPRYLMGPKAENGLRIKHEITKMFDQMAQKGAVGNEETFCLLMVALARQGDIEGVKAILTKVWDINVDALMAKDESDLSTPKAFAMDSPFRPSKTLLFSIAHIFGINNAIPVALRIVDYVSRHYSISIPIDVWEELLGWASVLSTRHTSRNLDDNTNVGQLPPEAVSNLWAALVAKPYGVKPSMVMYDKLIINLIRRQRFGEVQSWMEEAHQLYMKSVQRHSKTAMLMKMRSSLYNGEGCRDPQHPRGSMDYDNILDLQRDKNIQLLRLNRSYQFLCRWCRLFVSQGILSMKENSIFTAVNIPRFIYKFMEFMPPNVEYSTATGIVRFSNGFVQADKDRANILEARKYLTIKTRLARRHVVLENDAVRENDGTSPRFNLEPRAISAES